MVFPGAYFFHHKYHNTTVTFPSICQLPVTHTGLFSSNAIAVKSAHRRRLLHYNHCTNEPGTFRYPNT